jgi:hypothetical protein
MERWLMSARRSTGGPKARIALGAATAIAAAGGITGVTGAGAATAQPVSVKLNYTCGFPIVGSQNVPVKVETDIPSSIAVGKASPQFAIKSTVTAPGILALGLHLRYSVQTVEGSANADTTVHAPQGNIGIPVQLEIPKTSLPEFSSLPITANGTAPSHTFSKPGPATITAGDFVLHLILKNANGNLAGPDGGKFDVHCQLNPDQHPVVGSFTITRPQAHPGPTASASPSRTTPSTTSPGSPTSSHSNPTSSHSNPTPGPSNSTPVPTPSPPSPTPHVRGRQDTADSILIAVGAVVVVASSVLFSTWLRNRRRRTNSNGH